MTRRITRRRTLGLLATSVPLVTAAASATAASDGESQSNSGGGSIRADPNTAGASSTHAVTMTVDSAGGSSWNSLVVDYAGTGADVSDVGTGDVETLGIDRGDDADGTSIDVDASDDLSSVSSSNNGTTLRIGLGGNYTPESGDELVAVFGDVQNPPEAGTYDVTLVANEQSAADEGTGTLEIGSTEDESEGTTGSDGDDSDESDGGDEKSESSDDADGTDQACADIQFCDQSLSDGSITVRDTYLPDGGFVVVHGPDGDVIGHSAYLSPGEHEDVEVTLDTQLSGEVTLTAMAHTDADDDEAYDCGDGPYTCDGSPVDDTATVSTDC